jgi:inner membrane protein involved in colicin E2 resistance
VGEALVFASGILVLYVIISSEYKALAMGGGLTFVSLAMVMLVNRNINGYYLSKQLSDNSAKPDAKAG